MLVRAIVLYERLEGVAISATLAYDANALLVEHNSTIRNIRSFETYVF